MLILFLALCLATARAFVLKGVILEFVPYVSAVILGFTIAILYRIRFADRLVKTKELELDSILQAGMVTAGGLKADNAQDVIVGTIINSIGARGLLLRWKNEKTNIYEKRYVYGSGQLVLEGSLSAAEQRLIDNVIKSRKAVLVSDVKKDALFGVKASQAKVCSILCAPLLLNC